ncbi:MAG: hypothetical protein AAF598_17035, partial [Bacteroidota bacterium]
MKTLFSVLMIAFFATLSVQVSAQKQMEEEVTVITLRQTDGVFDVQKLQLQPGKYIFEVTNVDVDHDVAFFLTADGKNPIANSGLSELLEAGETQRSGVVTLAAGNYTFSC